MSLDILTLDPTSNNFEAVGSVVRRIAVERLVASQGELEKLVDGYEELLSLESKRALVEALKRRISLSSAPKHEITDLLTADKANRDAISHLNGRSLIKS